MQLAEVTTEYCESLWRHVCNWGRWGPDDQAGALNFITPEKRRTACALVTEGMAIGLGNPWPVAPGPHNPWPADHYMIRAGDDPDYPGVPGLSVALDYIGVQHHGVACSHVDALCHVFVGGRMYNDFPASEVKSTGAAKNAVSTMEDGVVTRGVLLDLPRALGEPYLAGDVRLSLDNLREAASAQSVELSPGDVLIVHKGRQRRVEDVGPIDPVADGMPGLHPECTQWFHECGVAMLGSDYMNDPQPNWECDGWPIPIHYLGICGMGMTLLHNLETEALARRCEELNRWEFLLAIAPLKIAGGTGSPVNPVAVL